MRMSLGNAGVKKKEGTEVKSGEKVTVASDWLQHVLTLAYVCVEYSMMNIIIMDALMNTHLSVLRQRYNQLRQLDM